ncbi:MAG: hypothetical protein KAI80_01465, partial [Hyphomicrobiaceae bacterium]|nr:hypothetical protein [Hyphomicrobiaceae bacterium]
MARTHIQPHLTIVDVEAGQSLIPFVAEDRILTPATNNRQITLKKRDAAGGLTSVGLRPPSVSPPAAHSHL